MRAGAQSGATMMRPGSAGDPKDREQEDEHVSTEAQHLPAPITATD
jgi:hypothetical protein